MNTERNASKMEIMEYCYCNRCQRIKSAADLIITEKGLQCSQCGGYNLDEPGWVVCPHQKTSAVKCPRAGKGIINTGYSLECTDRCFFRV